jgi:hypothetical protein
MKMTPHRWILLLSMLAGSGLRGYASGGHGSTSGARGSSAHAASSEGHYAGRGASYDAELRSSYRAGSSSSRFEAPTWQKRQTSAPATLAEARAKQRYQAIQQGTDSVQLGEGLPAQSTPQVPVAGKLLFYRFCSALLLGAGLALYFGLRGLNKKETPHK